MAFTLRDTAAPGFTNKGSALTYAEGDNNFIGLFDRDELRLALTGGTLTGSINVSSGQILSGGTDIATLLGGGGGGGATDLDGLTDAINTTNNTILGNVPAGISGTLNVAVGYTALDALTSGDGNTAIGHNALTAQQTGNNNVGVGRNAFASLNGANSNVGVGYNVGAAITTQGNNVIIGFSSGTALTSTSNTIIGYQAGTGAMSSGYNTFVGDSAGTTTTGAGQQNVALGYLSNAGTTGNYNVSVGRGTAGSTGSGNIQVGTNYSTTSYLTGNYSIKIGTQIPASSTSASSEFILGGNNVLLMNGDYTTAGSAKLMINPGAAVATPTATLHVKGAGATYATVPLLIEDSAGAQLMKLTDAGDNICIGKTAGDSITGGGGLGNVCIGKNAGTAITTSDYNIIIGDDARCSATSGNNIVMGQFAGDTTMGVNNTVLGAYSGFNLNGGGHNVFLGYFSGLACTSGDKNIAIGRESNVLNTGDNQIALGYGIVTTATDELNIGGNIIGSMTAADRYTKFVGQTYGDLYTQADGATITPDFTNGNTQTVELGDNRAIANPTNIKVGATYIIILKQDATGSRTVTWGTNYKFPGGSAPTLTTTGNQADVITLIAYSASVLMCSSTLNFATS